MDKVSVSYLFLLTITQALSTGGVCLFLVYGSSSVLALQVAHVTKHTIFSGTLQELLRKLYRSICNQKLNLLMVLDYSNKVKKNTSDSFLSPKLDKDNGVANK